ncbi:UxaA family hydrolase [Peribacillus frigoritolerans]|nr:UxaA family hydrolase [Peribacillus frigoritolerans]
MSEYKTLYLSRKDSVAVALSEIPAYTSVVVKSDLEELVVPILEPIRFGHKFAVKAIKQGEDIIKYGEVIGAASAFYSRWCTCSCTQFRRQKRKG